MGFECQKCGFCCQLDVKVGNEDIERIRKVIPYSFTDERDDGVFLAKTGVHCTFFSNNICSVYENRPDVCRSFPFEKDGQMSGKCRQRQDFHSKVTRNIIKFMNKKSC